MFELIKKATIKESEERAAKVRGYIMAAEADTLRTRYATPRRWEQYAAGEITLDALREYCAEREQKAEAKRLEKRLAKVDEIAATPAADCIVVDVEWIKSRTWGANPHAHALAFTAEGYAGETFGSASGCGYDKRSAATAEAFNASAAILRALYDAEEKRLSETPEKSRESAIGYGCGGSHSAMPYFEGGVGFSSHIHILEACGLECVAMNERGRNYDGYTFERRAGK